MTSRGANRPGIVSRLVQAMFLLAGLVLWVLATTRWGVNQLLLPRPEAVLQNLADILVSGEFVGDLAVTLTELAVAFVIAMSTGTIVGYAISRSVPDRRIRTAAVGHLRHSIDSVSSTLCVVLRSWSGLQDCAGRHDRFFSDRSQHHRRVRAG